MMTMTTKKSTMMITAAMSTMIRRSMAMGGDKGDDSDDGDDGDDEDDDKR